MGLQDTNQILQHNKEREQQAVRRKAGSREAQVAGGWLMTVPFAGIGMTNPRLALREIADFATTAVLLDPAPGDLVLDLGAGSCWVSEWLNKLLVKTVSLDIALDMLAIGQARLGAGARLTAGDFEKLPFADRQFDGAICLSALHHVPDIPLALREIRRVLNDDGAVVFSEPGRGHANHPQSIAERTELGVMERDIVAADLMAECQRAGFAQVMVASFPFPPPIYDPGSWQVVDTAARTAPSVRSLEGMAALGARLLAALPPSWRPRNRHKAASACGATPDPAAETLLAHNSLVTARNAIDGHPLIVARKGTRRPDSRRPSQLRAVLTLIEAPTQAVPGAECTIRVDVQNPSDTLWLSKTTPLGGFVALGAKLTDSQGLMIAGDIGRGFLSQDVAPGHELSVEIKVPAPMEPGQYLIKLDMVDECVAWFESWGSPPLYVPLAVLP